MTGLLRATSPGYLAATRPYTIGPTVEVELWRYFAVAADLLYKRMEYGRTAPGEATVTASRWELPLVVRRRFAGGAVQPLAGFGVSFNRVTGVHDPGGIAELRHRVAKGFVLDAGVDFRFGVLRLEPEVRVTRWTDRNFGVRGAPIRSSMTQGELLVGILF